MNQFAFKKTGDADYPRYLKVMVMGPPKSGKTTFVSTAPNVVVAACEAGLMSIAHKNIGYVDIDEYAKIDTLYTLLKDESLRKKVAAQLGLPQVETVAIDTLDAFQETVKKEILREARRTEMQQADWGKLKERMASILKAFCTLPMNVIFTVHSDVTQDEESRQIYAPMLQGSIKNDVAGYVDFSLMSKREKQTLPDGSQKIVYFLKNEGDEKNPHLGNRSAGRVPEICAPDFKTLHKLTFDALNLPKTAEIIIEEESEPATYDSQGAVTTSETIEVANVRTGVSGTPSSDADDPINAAGVTMLTKNYQAHGLNVPGDLEKWTLGEARQIARVFTVVKAEMVAGRASKSDLIAALSTAGRYEGEGQRQTAAPKKIAPVKVKAVKKAAPVAEPTESEAIEEVEQQLGAKIIGKQIEAGAVCDKCGKEVDDLDVAQLGWSKFRKVMCVDDYMALANAEKEA